PLLLPQLHRDGPITHLGSRGWRTCWQQQCYLRLQDCAWGHFRRELLPDP
ncbi:unnamed protein product, partial [Symbiodinium pilosum]